METLNIKYSNKYLHIYRYDLTINGVSLLPEEFFSVYTEHIHSSKKKLNSNNTLCSRQHGQFKKPRTLGSENVEVSWVLCTEGRAQETTACRVSVREFNSSREQVLSQVQLTGSHVKHFILLSAA